MPDIYEIRQNAVAALIRARYGGKLTAFANAIARSDNYVSRMLAKNENRKKIGERMARHIESTLKLPANFLDTGRAGLSDEKILYGLAISHAAVEVGREWDKLREPLRSQIRELIETLVAGQVREARGKKDPPRDADHDTHPN